MIKENILSQRMTAIRDMVPEGMRICDVGCDHGYISIDLLRRGISTYAVLMDINEGPLKRAKDNLDLFGIPKDRYELILSDGLCGYKEGSADVLIIAGMGGPLIQKILTDDPKKGFSFSEYVLSPQSEIPEFRAFLRSAGFTVTDEALVHEEGKFYTVIKCKREEDNMRSQNDPGPGEFDKRTEDECGPVLLKKKDPVLKEYIMHRLRECDIILCKLESDDDPNGRIRERVTQLRSDKKLFEDVLGRVF